MIGYIAISVDLVIRDIRDDEDRRAPVWEAMGERPGWQAFDSPAPGGPARGIELPGEAQPDAPEAATAPGPRSPGTVQPSRKLGDAPLSDLKRLSPESELVRNEHSQPPARAISRSQWTRIDGRRPPARFFVEFILDDDVRAYSSENKPAVGAQASVEPEMEAPLDLIASIFGKDDKTLLYLRDVYRERAARRKMVRTHMFADGRRPSDLE